MVVSQRTAHLRDFHQNDDQKIELYENQLDILEILCVDNIKMEDVDG